MSRIDEALKRARAAGGQPPANGAAGSNPASIPPADVFQDPWSNQPAAAPVHAEEPPRPKPPLVAVPKEPDGQQPADRSEGALAVFRTFHPSVVEKIVVTPAIRPAFAEQYRRLAGTLHHAQIERNVGIVMITSALANEGKTLTATNLALTLSESYRRSVLLVDADLRRPTLHDTFGVPNVFGLGDVLRAGHDQKLSLLQVTPCLTLLTAGRPDPDPMSGLVSERMKQLLQEAAARFAWVILDTPPVGLLPDANLMARMVDTTLFVVRAGQTPYQVIKKGVAAIGRDRIIGVVLNGADEALDGSYSYYRYYDAYSAKDRKAD